MKIPTTNIRQIYHVACTIGEVITVGGVPCLETRLSKLCTSGKINMWSKYKPMIHSYTSPRPTDWWKGSNGNCGITILSHGSATALMASLLAGTEQYSHEKPTSYHLADFGGYNPDALPVLRDTAMPEVLYQSTTTLVATALYKDNNFSDWEIPPADLFGSLEEWYMGVVIKNNYGTYYWMTASTPNSFSVSIPVSSNTGVFVAGTCQIAKFITKQKKTSLTSGSPTGEAVFMALPGGKVYTMTVKSSAIIGSITGIYKTDVGVEWTATIKNTSGSAVSVSQASVQCLNSSGIAVDSEVLISSSTQIGANVTKTYSGTFTTSQITQTGTLVLYINNTKANSTAYLVSST